MNSDPIKEQLFLLNNKVDRMSNIIDRLVSGLEIKKERKKTNDKKRCTFVSKRGNRCKGFFCKDSDALCYAHYKIARQSLKNTHFLFGSEKKNQ